MSETAGQALPLPVLPLAPRPWGRKAALGLGLGAGLLAWLAYPGAGLWPLALVCYVPLLAAIEAGKLTTRGAVLAGWLAGLVLHAGVFQFLAFTMREMSGMPEWVGWLTVGVHAAVMGLHQALWAGLVAWTRPERADGLLATARRAAWIAALYLAIEHALPFLFPWFLASALYATPLAIQAADLIGVVGVSAALVFVQALLARAVGARAGLPGRRGLPEALLAGAVVLALLGYGAWRMRQVDGAPARQSLRVTMVQHDATLQEKRAELVARRLPMLDRLEARTRALDLGQTDLIVWPEGAFPFYWVVDDPHVAPAPGTSKANKALLQAKARVQKLADDLDKPLLLGTLRRTDALWRDPGRNGSVLLRKGQPQWAYDKRILLPFGEYLPGTGLVPALKGKVPGVSDFEPGTTPGQVEVAGVRLLVNICYEALFGAFLRAEAGQADVLVNLTNDVWFGPQPAPELHLMVQQARAVELRRPLVRSTVAGITTWVDAAGRLGPRAPLFEAADLHVVVPVRDLDSPYRWWGDGPAWLVTCGVVAALGLRWRRQRA